MTHPETPMSELQAKLGRGESSSFRRYQELVVGSPGWLDLLLYEAAVTFLLPLPGALGYWLRQNLLGGILGRLGRGALIGRGLSLRHPRKIRVGDHVILDDDVALDAKGDTGGIEIGDHVMIGRATILAATGGTLSIGAGSNIGSRCRVATRDRLSIGRSVLVAANCYLGATNHRFDRTDVPVIAQGLDLGTGRGLVIEDNVWIGAGVTVLNDVTIGKDAIIGAHSLVTSDVPPFTIAVGSPARVLRPREAGDQPSRNE